MIPSHTFICWLAMKDRLLTRARLEIWGVCSDVLCLLCSATLGSQDHLFLSLIGKRWLGCKHHWRGQSLKAVICKFGQEATVYEIWKCSNAVLHQGCPSSEEQIITSIKKQVKMRLEFKGSFPCTKEKTFLGLSQVLQAFNLD